MLSFDEPTRFIFSHSALREGWDNPNVFQICTLKHSDSSSQKRQEVGRGLRLCVNQAGNRMDMETLGEDIHNINKLTVIASESYKGFVADLQSDIRKVLYDRPTAATSEYFKGKFVKVDGKPVAIDDKTANTNVSVWEINQKKKSSSETGKSILFYYKWDDFDPAWFISDDPNENRALLVEEQCTKHFIDGCKELVSTITQTQGIV